MTVGVAVLGIDPAPGLEIVTAAMLPSVRKNLEVLMFNKISKSSFRLRREGQHFIQLRFRFRKEAISGGGDDE